MADRGHELTDEYLKRLEQRMADEYSRAYEEMARKVLKYWEQFSEGEEKQRKLLEAGKITQAEYNAWRFRHIMVGQRWEAMLDVLTVDAHNTNVLARQMVAKAMPDVFMLNANYTTYQLEHDGRIDTGFTLYDHDAAMFLMEDRDLMPPPSEQLASRIAANKDMQWNKRHIQSAVLQGILQGENPYDIAKRLIGVAGMAGVGAMNYRAAVRYARTMVTSAQNAGRYEAFNRAERLGVELTIEWVATLDGRTRHEHRLMHGMRTKVNEPFVVNGIRILYPAQQGPGSSDIPQRLIWNCRCTLNGWVKGFEGDTVKSSPKMGGMSFEEWQHAKEPKKQTEQPKEVTIGDVLKKSLGGDFDEFKALLAKAPNVIRETYNKLSDKLQSVTKKSGGGWCAGRTITWDYRKKGNKWETLAHEYGHFVDNMIPKDKFSSSEISFINDYLKSHKQGYWSPPVLAKTVSSSDEFLTAMRQDRSALAAYVTDADYRVRVRNDLLGDNRNLTTGIQDAFDGFWLTRSSDDLNFYLPWGHGGAYYNREYNRRFVDYGYEKPLKEAFKELGFDASNQKKVKAILRDYETASELWANVQAAKTVGGTTLTLMEKYFPSTCKAFDELVKAGVIDG